ncbi:MAG TPA: prepilin-type N-terminal cleavage/methylation domain-containing protein [Polyangia bacterium]|nr:prepilin-type N-terminal cleavage/methylation domain-containing protein [Polyangia bacterium]
MHRARRHAGFTLIELMVVVAIIIVVSVLAVRFYSGGRRGAAADSFARTMLALAHQARQYSMATRSQTRLRFVPGAPPVVFLEQFDTAAATWAPISQTPLPADVQLCVAAYATAPGPLTPTCPATSELRLEYTNGGVQVRDGSNSQVCPSSGSLPCTGISLPFGTTDNAHQYKVHVFGLTGLPRLMDQW